MELWLHNDPRFLGIGEVAICGTVGERLVPSFSQLKQFSPSCGIVRIPYLFGDFVQFQYQRESSECIHRYGKGVALCGAFL